MQSPRSNNTTIKENKKFSKGVGYTTIFTSDLGKFELSNKESVLRVTTCTGECLYSIVKEPEKIQKIEFRSENWVRLNKRSDQKYIILEQKNADNKRTGYIKIIKNSKVRSRLARVSTSNKDCAYYEQRKTNL